MYIIIAVVHTPYDPYPFLPSPCLSLLATSVSPRGTFTIICMSSPISFPLPRLLSLSTDLLMVDGPHKHADGQLPMMSHLVCFMGGPLLENGENMFVTQAPVSCVGE